MYVCMYVCMCRTHNAPDKTTSSSLNFVPIKSRRLLDENVSSLLCELFRKDVACAFGRGSAIHSSLQYNFKFSILILDKKISK